MPSASPSAAWAAPPARAPTACSTAIGPQAWVEVRGPHVALYTDRDPDEAPEIAQEIERRLDASDKSGVPKLRALLETTAATFYASDIDLNYFDYSARQSYMYRMSWMLTHYLMTTDGPLRARFDDYLAALSDRRTGPLFSDGELDALEGVVLEQYAFRMIPGLRMRHPAPPPVVLQVHPVSWSIVPRP